MLVTISYLLPKLIYQRLRNQLLRERKLYTPFDHGTTLWYGPHPNLPPEGEGISYCARSRQAHLTIIFNDVGPPGRRALGRLRAPVRPVRSRSPGVVCTGSTTSSTTSCVFRPFPVMYATVTSSDFILPCRTSFRRPETTTPPAVSVKMPSVSASSLIPSTTSSSGGGHRGAPRGPPASGGRTARTRDCLWRGTLRSCWA